jgi:hypothetical protein
LLVILGFGYRAYLRYQGYDFAESDYLPNSITNLQAKAKSSQQELDDKQKVLDKLRESDDLIRYDIARYINNKEKTTNRSDNINNLVRMYTELQNVARTTNNGIILTDFTIQQDSIQVRGQIQELKFMYIKNGIIDRFSALEFVDNITIPYYQKNGEYFDFILKADVVEQEKNEGQVAETGTGTNTN